MAFASYEFVLLFLPIAVIGYFVFCRVPGMQFEKLFLLAASALFYACAGVKCLIFAGISILFNWLCYRLIQHKDRRVSTCFMILGICANVLFLISCKYGNIFLAEINRRFSLNYAEMHIIIPLGISFLTFNQISFLVDGYRQEFPKAHLGDYALYIMFFPKIISGPLMGFNEFSCQLQNEERRKICWEHVSNGMETFILGMGKKVLLADTLGKIVDYGFSNIDCMNMINSIVVMICFTFEIYFDFSGYSDMAVGIAKMMNFELPVNFDSPYRAVNIKEFWDRWHISLTKFLTKYIYIPLGGSRRGKIRTYLNILIVFSLSGLWHGSGMTFLVWGILHALAMCVYRAFYKILDRIPKVIQWAVLFGYLNITWFIFRADSFGQIRRIVSGWDAAQMRLLFLSDDMLHMLLRPEVKFIADAYLPEMSLNTICYFLFEVLIGLCFVLVLAAKNNMRRTYRQNPLTAVALAALLFFCVISFGKVQVFIYQGF